MTSMQLAPTETNRVAVTSSLLNQMHASVKLKVLSDPTRFNAKMASVMVADSRYTLVTYGTAVALDCTYDQPSESTILCLRGSCVIHVDSDSRRLVRGQGVVSRARSGLRAEFSHDCERLVIRTRQPDFVPSSPRVESLCFNRSQAQAFSDLLTATSQSPALLDCIARHPSVTQPFARLLRQLLACGAPIRADTSAHASTLPATLLKAESLMRERLSQPVTLAALAEAACISPRALQLQFRQHRGQTPMQVLRTIRLDSARRLLERPDSGGRVSEIALKCGLSHAGRFAFEYRQRFGESPSNTWERARR